MTNIEKIKQLEEKRAKNEGKAKKYQQLADDLAQQIESLKSMEIQNILNQVDMPFEDVLKMLAERLACQLRQAIPHPLLRQEKICQILNGRAFERLDVWTFRRSNA